jgi:hypothetical protein
MSCYDQGVQEVSATNFTQSMHYTFAPTSLIVTVSLSAKEDLPGGFPFAFAAFTRTRQLNFPDEPLPNPTGLFQDAPSHIRDNDLTEIWGFLYAFNCRANAVVNFFAWPQGLYQHRSFN